MKKKIKVNGREFEFQKGEKIIEIISRNGIELASLCFHPDLKIKSSCRLCMVEIDGKQVPACSTKASDGMDIKTDTLGIKRARKTNLEMIFSQHCEECADCVWFSNCQLLRFAKKYRVDIGKFPDRKTKLPTFKIGNVLEFDSSKCIDCRNCIEVCENQGIGFLEAKERGHLREVVPSDKPNKHCIYCGQCILHCPAGAFEAVGEFESTKELLADKGKLVVFQIAPAVRVSIGEEFGLPVGTVVTERLVASLKALGADYVFDVSSGADFTTIEESKEAISQKKNLPILTSCCPSWVRYIELYQPELIPNLSSARSPHIILGGLLKTFWSKKKGIDPNNIFVISLMPCLSKKFEIERRELEISGMRPVDKVMTVREAARMMKTKGIDLATIDPIDLDDPFGRPSGAGINYGVSGGVMESVLKNIGIGLVDFQSVSPGIREAEVTIDNKHLKVAVVNGLGNAKRLIEKDLFEYHCIEVMACPGGCIGGGGQPVPSDDKIISARREALRGIGDGAIAKTPNQNPAVKEIYEYPDLDDQIFHKK